MSSYETYYSNFTHEFKIDMYFCVSVTQLKGSRTKQNYYLFTQSMQLPLTFLFS